MIIGVDLGGTKVRAGVIADGKILKQKEQLFRSKESREATLEQLVTLIRSLVGSDLNGIGLGVPSVIDVEQGIVYNVVNIPSWVEVPLKSILESEFGVTVTVNNDVNCFALGEHRFGSLKGCRNAVGITVGTGLGAGIIVNNQLFHGRNCGAGEIGLLAYLDHNIEYYASGNFFEAVHQTTALKAHDLALQNDPQALKWWKEFGTHMGQVIKTVVYAYDPDAITIGGSVAKAYKLFSAAMTDALRDFTFPESIRKLRIYQSQNDNITLLGAASLINNGTAHPVNA